ncbi:MAG: type II toxin-antitoxin system RelE/ParE family toxin [Pseudomonadales bacterium]
MKKIVFLGKSLKNIRDFPRKAIRETGFQLDKVQQGKEPDDWKPMKRIGPGVREIRISEDPGIYRVAYTANIEGVVYVLHAFQKKTQTTSRLDIEAARKAYKKVLEYMA